MIYPVTITITIETEVEADNPQDAEQQAFQIAVEEHGQRYPIDVVVHDPEYDELNPESDFFSVDDYDGYDTDNYYYDDED